MDDVDRANEQADADLARRLRATRADARPIDSGGECLNCDAPLPSRTQRFCDDECARDWKHRREVRRKQGEG